MSRGPGWARCPFPLCCPPGGTALFSLRGSHSARIVLGPEPTTVCARLGWGLLDAMPAHLFRR